MQSKQKSPFKQKHYLPGRRVFIHKVPICCTKLFDLFLMVKQKDHSIKKNLFDCDSRLKKRYKNIFSKTNQGNF